MLRLQRWLLIAAVCAVSSTANGLDPPFTQWTAVIGDWHNPSNWDMGVPGATSIAIIDQGEAQFAFSATARFLNVGGRDGDGKAVGTANLDVYGYAEVGLASGTGEGTTSTGTGSLTITGADLTVLPDEEGPPSSGFLSVGIGGGTGTNTSFTGVGSLTVVDGNINVAAFARVGGAGGTGTNTTLQGTGQLTLTRGDLSVRGGLDVGTSGGTGESNGIASGEVLVEHGDIIMGPHPDFLESSISVGTFGGTSSALGHGMGTLTLVDGQIVVEVLRVGVTSGIVDAHGSSDGRLTVRDGEIAMKSMTVGVQFENGGPTSGLVELLSSRATGEGITLGNDGKIVLGIGGQQASEYGHIAVTAAAILDGDVEARFVDGFQPSPGDVFDLITAGAITDHYMLTVTGINPFDYPNMVITRNSSLLRIAFVPEPNGIALAAIGLVAFASRRRQFGG
jgi:hypothetical protein